MERVLAHEMHDRHVECVAACAAALGGEEGGFGLEVFEFGAFGGGVGAVGGNCATVLRKGGVSKVWDASSSCTLIRLH